MSDGKQQKLADESAVRSRDKDLKNADDTLLGDIEFVMSTPRGRRFVWWVMEIAQMHGVSVKGTDAGMAVLLLLRDTGAAEVGRQVMLKINEKCPDLWAQMIKEHG